ncbi:MAG: HAMP domain-containing sensor histidine kinase [Proteobacteria bacterium]|nr:HAMP domain-containing sensor histidine kinase [Pseudomonadota bacterium]
MTRLVNDILDLAAIEAGKVKLNKEEISAEEIVKDCSRFIIKAVSTKDIRYVVDVSAHLPSLHADKRAIKQILINLLSNAVKYTPKGGQIDLSATVSKGHHVFEIRDNGTGIPKEKLPHLTEAFVRGETDPHKAQEGTGLGLAIVKSLVDLHDGELTIESEVDKGTVVTVSLPSDIG